MKKQFNYLYSCCLTFLLFMFIMESYPQSFNVITVPYNPEDISIPHPAYNYHPTTFKAIARNSTGSTSDQYYYRWDFDGDGQFDPIDGKTPISGSWYRNNGNDLSGKYQLPYVDPTLTKMKWFTALIEAATELDGDQGINSVFATYPVLVFADVPAITDANSATDKQLFIMAQVATDDALYNLHCKMTKVGNGNASITGYLTSNSTITTTALFALAMEENNRIAAYPPGTYNDFGQQVPSGFNEINNHHYNNDPYSEDVIRALNYLLSYASNISIQAVDETDDGLLPIPGTNDNAGIYIFNIQNNEYNSGSLPLAALASSGLAGTVAQVSNTNVRGKSFEYIVQQYVDFAIMSQIDENSPPNSIGSWYYNPCQNSGYTENYAISYVTAGWLYALYTAEQMYNNGVIINNRMKNRLANALYFGQHADGGVKYTNGSTSESLAEQIGLYLLGCRWLGWDLWSSGDNTSAGYPYLSATKGALHSVYNNYLTYLEARWQDSYVSGSLFNHNIVLWSDGDYNGITPGLSQSNLWIYSLFNVSRAFGYNSTSPIQNIGIHQWKREFDISFIKSQLDDGGFKDAGNSLVATYLGLVGACEYAAMTMRDNKNFLVANFEASAYEIIKNMEIEFDAGKSFSYYLNNNIVEYQWDFNCSDPAEFSSEASGIIVTHTFNQTGTYHVMLRIKDDSNPSNYAFDEHQITVSDNPNQAPTANAGEDQTIESESCEGIDVTLDGSGSSDPDDDPIFYTWYYNGEHISSSSILHLILSWGTYIFTLVVVDEDGLSTTDDVVINITYPGIDGDLSDPRYLTIGTKQNTNSGFSQSINIKKIVYYTDAECNVLFLGIEGRLNTASSDGIGLWINFDNASGLLAGTSLGDGVGSHYMNGNSGEYPNFKADFEVDYMFAINPGESADNVYVDVVGLVGSRLAQYLGNCGQSGIAYIAAPSSGLFAGCFISFAFDNSGEENKGFEIAIPFDALGVTEASTMQAFACIVSSAAYFSDVTVPGNVTTGNPYYNSNFNTLSGGPYHTGAVPFPVELVSFTAKVSSNIVNLTWQTATEVNNCGFEVERQVGNRPSAVGSSQSEIRNPKWERIGFIHAHGNSNSPKEYSFVDKNLYGGCKFQYRLKQIDNDGQFEYSNVIEVEIIPDKYKLSQNYPNPFNPTTTIRFSIAERSDVKIAVINTIGEEVDVILNEEKEPGYYQVEFNAITLPSGVYFYKIQAGNYNAVKKMLLMK